MIQLIISYRFTADAEIVDGQGEFLADTLDPADLFRRSSQQGIHPAEMKKKRRLPLFADARDPVQR